MHIQPPLTPLCLDKQGQKPIVYVCPSVCVCVYVCASVSLH